MCPDPGGTVVTGHGRMSEKVKKWPRASCCFSHPSSTGPHLLSASLWLSHPCVFGRGSSLGNPEWVPHCLLTNAARVCQLVFTGV